MTLAKRTKGGGTVFSAFYVFFISWIQIYVIVIIRLFHAMKEILRPLGRSANLKIRVSVCPVSLEVKHERK